MQISDNLHIHMPAHTAGRIGGSLFASKKGAAASSSHVHNHMKDHRDNGHTFHIHHSYNSSPLILSSSSMFHHSPLVVTVPMISDGSYVAFLIAFHIVGYILWSRYNDI